MEDGSVVVAMKRNICSISSEWETQQDKLPKNARGNRPDASERARVDIKGCTVACLGESSDFSDTDADQLEDDRIATDILNERFLYQEKMVLRKPVFQAPIVLAAPTCATPAPTANTTNNTNTHTAITTHTTTAATATTAAAPGQGQVNQGAQGTQGTQGSRRTPSPGLPGVTKVLHNKTCDLIADAASTYAMHPTTTMLAIHLFDRGLALTVGQNEKPLPLQLMAATCLMIAAKLEEIHPPFPEELTYYCGNIFDKDDIPLMESYLLPLFGYQVAIPTRYEFSQRFAEAAGLKPKERAMVLFLLELSFLDFSLNYFPHSEVAAGAIHLTLQMLRSTPEGQQWPPNLAAATRCAEPRLVEIVVRLRKLHWDVETSAMRYISKRYITDAHLKVAEVVCVPYDRLRFDTPLKMPRVEPEFPDYSTFSSVKKAAQGGQAQGGQGAQGAQGVGQGAQAGTSQALSIRATTHPSAPSEREKCLR
ncbi:cyclin-like protein [Ochromonadaceae sp. CCMP2298]|nr:cyclin-like protein [Ochromonadaceae sp. CCMP2298]KAJ1419417.1 cyclin-like protein [Ochromonadaceae sp. CCMP2298]